MPVHAVVVIRTSCQPSSVGAEPTLFLSQNILAFAIVTLATRDDFKQHSAGVRRGFVQPSVGASPSLRSRYDSTAAVFASDVAQPLHDVHYTCV